MAKDLKYFEAPRPGIESYAYFLATEEVDGEKEIVGCRERGLTPKQEDTMRLDYVAVSQKRQVRGVASRLLKSSPGLKAGEFLFLAKTGSCPETPCWPASCRALRRLTGVHSRVSRGTVKLRHACRQDVPGGIDVPVMRCAAARTTCPRAPASLSDSHTQPSLHADRGAFMRGAPKASRLSAIHRDVCGVRTGEQHERRPPF